jgi:hypothetical protein
MRGGDDVAVLAEEKHHLNSSVVCKGVHGILSPRVVTGCIVTDGSEQGHPAMAFDTAPLLAIVDKGMAANLVTGFEEH